MFCSGCGFENAIDAAYCAKCGAKLGAGPQPPGPAADRGEQGPSFATRYDYSQGRSYGTASGSILGWILVIVAGAGLAGCFLPFLKEGMGASQGNTIWAGTEVQKWLMTLPVGFGLIILSGLLLGAGKGSPKTWMTFSGIGTGLAVSAVLSFALAKPPIFPSLDIGGYLIMGSAAICLIVAIVEGFWPS
ncbi:MAG: zinc ribbon domain-containing protein [Fimbriimonadaceae bacterium]